MDRQTFLGNYYFRKLRVDHITQKYEFLHLIFIEIAITFHHTYCRKIFRGAKVLWLEIFKVGGVNFSSHKIVIFFLFQL